MSVLPNQIPPQTVPFGSVDQDGKTVKIAHNYWLFLYNISQAVLGNSGVTAAAAAAQTNADLDALVDSTEELGLVQRVSNLEGQIESQYPSVVAALYPADPLLQDPQPRAPPVQVITPGGSPYTYTALADGMVIISGGTVSGIAISRDGTTFYSTGLVSGTVPVSRLDQVKTAYSGAPTMAFFPR